MNRARNPASFIATLTLLVGAGVGMVGAPAGPVVGGLALTALEVQSLDGSGNNVSHPEWGKVGMPYARVGAARYADGRSQPVAGPNARYVSNREYNDVHQNIFSERRISQWNGAWGQFLDHTFGLAQGASGTADPSQNIAFNNADPLESFTNTLGYIPFQRNVAAPGTGVSNARQQINTVSSYIDGWPVYGGTQQRLEWLREGPVDGNLANNSAKLLLPNGDLPRADTRGDPASAPRMDVDGRLLAQPSRAAVAGDVRANENLNLTAVHTLFAREHNRIVSLLPSSLTEEQKFQIARRVVIAEQQYVTYQEFLPAMGVRLPLYGGYNPNVNATLSNEFATVGYRLHSQIHGEIEVEADADEYTTAQLDALEAQGIEVTVDGADVTFGIPLNVAFFNPNLVDMIGLGPLVESMGDESQYQNDEQIDNQLRSVLFQVPVSGNPECLDGPELPECFNGVLDLGAIDIERGRDHGMPSYNQLRQAYGLPAKTSFTAITGEASESFPADPLLTPGNEVNDPNSLDFVKLLDIDGNPVAAGTDAATTSVVTGVRRTPLAARLKAVYGSVDKVDAFSGMLAEKHVPGAEFGELQLAIWTRQFQALRDGDRFFYGNDPGLSAIAAQYGIDFHRSLAQIIASNTDVSIASLPSSVFLVEDGNLPPVACHVDYRVDSQWKDGFITTVTITNTGTTPINGWNLRWWFANGQLFTNVWTGKSSQSGPSITVSNLDYNAVIASGGTATFGFTARWDNTANSVPPTFTLNNARCAST